MSREHCLSVTLGVTFLSVILCLRRSCVKFQATTRWRCVRLRNSENRNWQSSPETVESEVAGVGQQAVNICVHSGFL